MENSFFGPINEKKLLGMACGVVGKSVGTVTYIMCTSRDFKVCTLLPELRRDWIFSNIIEAKVVRYYVKSVCEVCLDNHLHHRHFQGLQGVHPFA